MKHLEIYAKNLGLVFQLQDDLFDYDEDIKLKKKTFATVLGKSEVEKLYLRLLLATDFISGMTDSYSHRLYLDMVGI